MNVRSIAAAAIRLGLFALFALCAAAASLAQTDTTKFGPRPIQPPSTASSARLSLAELTKQADVIAVGRITGFRSEWNASHTRVYPCAVLNAAEYLKASRSEPTIAIAYAESGPSMVRFQKDEEILVFLRRDEAGNLQVVGGTQGKFVITKDIRTALRMVSAYQSFDQIKAQVTALLRSNPGTQH